MTDITKEVIEAVISRVQSQVTDLNNRVYTMVPQNIVFPYARVLFTVNKMDNKTADMQEIILTFHIYAQSNNVAGSPTQLLNMAKSLYNAINHYNFTFSLGNCVLSEFAGFQTILDEEDGKTAQLITRYKIIASN